ncbi:MAG TPA: hypothetical protein VNT52_00870 [Acidimicrobiales bacterium]|nr:hypothetical protein [Acidimicrobiales bacterium]
MTAKIWKEWEIAAAAERLAERVARLNPDAGETGAGMLAHLVAEARAIVEARAARSVPRCACCGTAEGLHADYGSGGPYRCASPDCMVF